MNSLRALMLTAAMAAFAALGVSHRVHARSYPSKPVRVIVPAPAGGNAREVGRTVFERVSATRPAACAAACRDFLLRIAAAQPSRSEP